MGREFCWSRTKTKGSSPSVASLPKKGQNSGRALENYPYLGNEKNRSGFNGNIVALDVFVICVVDKKLQSQKILFAPSIKIFGSKKHIFAPSGQLEPQWSMFSTRKRCLIGLPIWGYQKFYSLPPKKLDFGPKKGQIWPKTGILGQISAILAHLI